MKTKAPRPSASTIFADSSSPQNISTLTEKTQVSQSSYKVMAEEKTSPVVPALAQGLRKSEAAKTAAGSVFALKSEVKTPKIFNRPYALLNEISADSATRESLRTSRSQNVPYFFMRSPKPIDGQILYDAGAFFMSHERRRMVAFNSQPSKSLPAQGELYVVLGEKPNADAVLIGNLSDLENDPSLYEFLLDATKFAYGKHEDIYEHEAIAEACCSLAFHFGLAGLSDKKRAALLVKDMSQDRAQYGFSFAMSHAVELDRPDMVAYCLNHGGDPLTGTRYGSDEPESTPLERAVFYGDARMASLMLQSTSAKDLNEWLPKIFSKERGWDQMPNLITTLLEANISK